MYLFQPWAWFKGILFEQFTCLRLSSIQSRNYVITGGGSWRHRKGEGRRRPKSCPLPHYPHANALSSIHPLGHESYNFGLFILSTTYFRFWDDYANSFHDWTSWSTKSGWKSYSFRAGFVHKRYILCIIPLMCWQTKLTPAKWQVWLLIPEVIAIMDPAKKN